MVMPDERGRRECDSAPCRLQAPADIDVVTRAKKDRIEAADRQQRRSPDGEVATWNVVREPIIDEHMARTTG